MASMCGRRSIRQPTFPRARVPLAPTRSRLNSRPCAGHQTRPDRSARARELLRAAAGLFFAVSGCGAASSVAPLPAGGIHVLFIGNSLTYTNDLPGTVAQIAALAGDTIRTRTVAAPDLALIDHVNGASDAVSVIKGERWNFVVLQQGPS